MPDSESTPLADWNRLKPSTEHAVGELLKQIQQDSSAQDLLDTYLYAKRLLAESMQALIRTSLPSGITTFQDLRKELSEVMLSQYGDQIPEEYLSVPYGSRTHEELFTLLLQHLGNPVTASLLRVVTKDSVHAERRTRELRELGLDIETRKANGVDVYMLKSLTLDIGIIPSIIKNNLRSKKAPSSVREAALTVLGG
ncbi:hypothetical protein [Streptomyces sp. CoH27]|uniref:hypothetical protein n=1 Tax=Streptomyces sp. CoH27 TaxID=2875763 RepID=UPI001CD7A79E|nr:hypothetical protein [Streptomyces sp. CoH27]